MKPQTMFVNENIVILFGSQTGNAQDLAERIWRELKRYYFVATIKSMDDYNVRELICEKCVIFVCSTTGQGDEPDNMKQFWRFLLKKNLPTDSLIKLKYAVLGLGDSSYVKYNFAAKRLNKRLAQLGAQQLIPLGLGDDQHDLGYDAAADPWIEQLFQKLLHFYPLPIGVNPIEANAKIIPRYRILLPKLAKNPQLPPSIYYSTRKPNEFEATVLANERTTHPDHFQDVRLLKLEAKHQTYKPGDVLVLRPKNFAWQIEEFKNLLAEHNVRAGGYFKVVAGSQEITLPNGLGELTHFDRLCEEYFDLMAIPRRHTFNILAQLTDSELEREKCLEFTKAEGQQDLYTYCNRPKRNIVEVLRDFPHATKNLTRDMLFEIIPAIKPREFSIASSSAYNEHEVHILLAVVRYKTKLVKERFGLCSNYLADLKPGDTVSAWLKPGSFKFPQDAKVPIIMVGPGTGVAPFRNLIFERVKQGAASSDKLVLFFGCRNERKDFHCRDEFIKLSESGQLNLITAFSRDQENKVYVQHKIIENKELVWDLLKNKNASVFIAGSAKFMPQQVREAFVNVCKDVGGLTDEESQLFIEKLEKLNRYQTECWS